MKKFSNFNNVYKPKNESTSFKPNVEKKVFEYKKPKDDTTKFLSKLFESREVAHIFHLQTKGEKAYAKHIALQEYYEGVIGEIDTLVEIYQAENGIVDGYDVIDTNVTMDKEPIAYFEELLKYIKKERYCFDKEDTHFFSIIDNILVLLCKLIFKLKNL